MVTNLITSSIHELLKNQLALMEHSD